MNEPFSLRMPFTRFARNVVLVSLVSLLPLLVLYVALQPGFAAMLLNNRLALSRFLRQVLTNGLPVVFVVNYIGFSLFAWSKERPGWRRNRLALVPADMAIRLLAFFLLHAAIYVVSADWYGSFGGSRATALRVVAPTLARSASFENISGVYLYATLLSALPIYAIAFDLPRGGSEAKGRLPNKAGPWLAALAMGALSALTLTLASRVIVWLQSG